MKLRQEIQIRTGKHNFSVVVPKLLHSHPMAALSSFLPTCLHQSTSKMTIRPLAVLKDAQKLRVPFELKQEQNRLFHQLPSGLNMEVIVQKGAKEKNPNEKNPPLVFVHGSYHAAWCWAEHWLPFFSGSGFDCYAISLLGQVKTDTLLLFREMPNDPLEAQLIAEEAEMPNDYSLAWIFYVYVYVICALVPIKL